MILRMTNNVARCITTLMLCVGPAALIMAQTNSPIPTALVTSPPTNSPTTISTIITASPTSEVTIISTIAPTTSAPISVAPTTAAPVSLTPTTIVIVPDTTLAPVTAAPTTASPVTLSPVSASPTLSPIEVATNSPTAAITVITNVPSANTIITDAPTVLNPVTLAPIVATATPSNEPATAAPTTISNSTAPTLPTNTTAPTTAPTILTLATTAPSIATAAPSDSPSATPTIKVTTIAPSASPSLTTATSAPTTTSASPSETATSQSPTPKIETQPPTSVIKPTINTGLKMTLTGISRTNDPSKWSSVTSDFFKAQYENSNQMFDIEVRVTHTTETSISTKNNRARRMMIRGSRGLQTDDSVEVTYNQFTTYATSNPELTLDDVLKMPLMNVAQQDEYISELKKQLSGYESLTAVSTVSLPSDDDGNDSAEKIDPETSDSSFPLWAIITIAVGGAALLICIIPFVCRKCRSNSSQQSGLAPPGHLNAGEETIETTDYDYSNAYEASAGNFSLSDAGGTLGQRTQQTGSELVQHQMGDNTIFSEDPTYDEAAYGRSRREEMIDIYAPAGKLGVVIDTPNDGAPIVHAVKDTSPIATKIQVGDRLVAVDDQDVRTMTAIQVSKLISKKSVNASRKMTVIRHV